MTLPDKDADAIARVRVKADFIARRGFWAPPFEAILQTDHDLLAAYVELSSAPWERPDGLEAKVKEFIYIAADASTTHLHPAGTRSHIRAAIGHGATAAELMAVLELVSLLGLQSLDFGGALLRAELEPDRDVAYTPAADNFSELAWSNPALSEQVKHLIGIGLNACVTHLDAGVARRHIRGALDAGASPADVVEVLELVSVLGIHGLTMAVPILLEELQAGGMF